jgi:phosphoglycerol transferase MdoB-like AlkP superfamily enzyme
MLKNLAIVFRYFFFWLLFFFLERLIFLLWFSEKLRQLAAGEILRSFIVGLWMDASMAAYISILPLLLVSISWLIPAIRISSKVLRWYTIVLVVIFSIIAVFNYNIYREWGSKINFKALDIAFTSPNEALASSASSPILLSLIVLAGLIAAGIWLSRKVVVYHRLGEVNIFLKILSVVLLLGLNFLAIRGGWQLSPMNESMAYYSATPVLNHAAVNTEWALLRDILNNKSAKNPYKYLPKQEAARLVGQIYAEPKAVTTSLLSTQRPNVVLVIMESFTADVVESLGGDKGVAPQTEKLAREGILFSNIYASGDRTDKGTVAVLNAFPSQAIKSIMKSNAKQEKLPSLSQNFAAYGYNTIFLYGGESEFFNMKSYLLSHKYQRIIDKKNFKQSEMNSKWGAYDDVVYRRAFQESSKLKQPFFSTILTLTNHEPFEVPGASHFAGDGVINLEVRLIMQTPALALI